MNVRMIIIYHFVHISDNQHSKFNTEDYSLIETNYQSIGMGVLQQSPNKQFFSVDSHMNDTLFYTW